ncbi:hypothetical protein WA158_000479 [Blastocystis sp. Blastoise]
MNGTNRITDSRQKVNGINHTHRVYPESPNIFDIENLSLHTDSNDVINANDNKQIYNVINGTQQPMQINSSSSHLLSIRPIPYSKLVPIQKQNNYASLSQEMSIENVPTEDDSLMNSGLFSRYTYPKRSISTPVSISEDLDTLSVRTSDEQYDNEVGMKKDKKNSREKARRMAINYKYKELCSTLGLKDDKMTKVLILDIAIYEITKLKEKLNRTKEESKTLRAYISQLLDNPNSISQPNQSINNRGNMNMISLYESNLSSLQNSNQYTSINPSSYPFSSISPLNIYPNSKENENIVNKDSLLPSFPVNIDTSYEVRPPSSPPPLTPVQSMIHPCSSYSYSSSPSSAQSISITAYMNQYTNQNSKEQPNQQYLESNSIQSSLPIQSTLYTNNNNTNNQTLISSSSPSSMTSLQSTTNQSICSQNTTQPCLPNGILNDSTHVQDTIVSSDGVSTYITIDDELFCPFDQLNK